jgi:ATP-binding cassette subfamily B protein
VRHADVIHVVEAGRIVESGDHETLVRASGSYAALWRLQTGESSSTARADMNAEKTAE